MDDSPVRPVFIQGTGLFLFLFDESSPEHYQWINDPEINVYTSRHRLPITRLAAQQYAETCQKDDQMVLGIWADPGGHVGNISLKNINMIDRCAELSILIGKRKRRGVGTEACRLLCAHGFYQLGLNRIYCGTHEHNIGMQKLAVKLGMQEEGRSRQAFFKHGDYADIIHYGVLKEEFIHADLRLN